MIAFVPRSKSPRMAMSPRSRVLLAVVVVVVGVRFVSGGSIVVAVG